MTLFLLTIFGLLIGAAIKGQLDRFGVDLTSTGQRKSLWQVRSSYTCCTRAVC